MKVDCLILDLVYAKIYLIGIKILNIAAGKMAGPKTKTRHGRNKRIWPTMRHGHDK